jgi:hypothetical protein
MDRWQFRQCEAGRMNASGAELAKRSAAARVNGIGDKIALGRLNQKCGVIYPGCAGFA